MSYANWLNQEIKKSITEKDIACRTCKFNFGIICAAHDSLWGYGGKIDDDLESCDQWGLSLDHYVELADKVENIKGVKE